MTPTLRKSTRTKTETSLRTAKDANWQPRPRPPPTRKQLYRHNQGLVPFRTSKDLEAITIANAANSPLLRLPSEIRTMIFKYAVTSRFSGYIRLCPDPSGADPSGKTVHTRKYEVEHLSITLPQVCRQVYTETATLHYSENKFGFLMEKSLKDWLSSRLLAQRKAIKRLVLSPRTCSFWGVATGGGPNSSLKGATSMLGKDVIKSELKKMCPNLISLDEDNEIDRVFSMQRQSWVEDYYDHLIWDSRWRRADTSSDIDSVTL